MNDAQKQAQHQARCSLGDSAHGAVSLAGIRAVIFDFAGVMTVALPMASEMGAAAKPVAPEPEVAEQVSDKAPSIRSIIRSVIARELRNDDPNGIWNRLERGEDSVEEFAKFLDAQHPGAGELFLAFSPTMMSGLSVRRDVVDYVRRCREAGFQTALLTNNVAEWRAVWQQNLRDAGAFDLFDVIVDSSDVGMRKPEERIYLHTTGLLGIKPHQAAFIDDFGHNVDGANAAGLFGVHATTDDAHLAWLDDLLASRRSTIVSDATDG